MSRLPFADRFTYHAPLDMPPRPWQAEGRDAYRLALSQHTEGQFTYFVFAATGAGKMALAALLAAETLNKGLARRVVYVCPNRVIRCQARRTFRRFGIHLVEWSNQRHRSEGEPVGAQGAALTYQALARCPDAHARLCRMIPTLVIFDEVHHLGDSQEWELAARAAFDGLASGVLSLSGTPYRGDNREIPFVSSTPGAGDLRLLCPDFSYPLGRAIVDGYCRRPDFRWLNGKVSLSVNGNTQTHDFYSEVSEDTSNLLLGGAVRPGSGTRLDALREALDVCRAQQRKLIIFVGGDTGSECLATQDAQELLPAELLSLGLAQDEILSVTSANRAAGEQLQSFGKSRTRVLITVNMVSEGVDIPELSAALFLTSITAKATTVQRIGRAIRGNDPATVLVFMFRDRRYVRLAEEIERERCEWEIRLRRPRQETESNGSGSGGRRTVEAIGLEAWTDGLTINGRTYTQEQVERAEQHLRSRNRPHTDAYLEATLDTLFPEGPST
jgi:superfamily II DNA or RNA helicase